MKALIENRRKGSSRTGGACAGVMIALLAAVAGLCGSVSASGASTAISAVDGVFAPVTVPAPIAPEGAGSEAAEEEASLEGGASVESAVPPGFARLPGHVIPGLALATRVPDAPSVTAQATGGSQEAMTLTVVLRRDDEAGFARYLSDVYDPHSTIYRQFANQRELARRFGPSRESYRAVSAYLRHNGFSWVRGSRNRLSFTVRASRTVVERALSIHIAEYRRGEVSFHANDTDPALPIAIASHVRAITGLSDLAQPRSVTQKQKKDILKACGIWGSPLATFGSGMLGLISTPVGILLFVPSFYCALAQNQWQGSSGGGGPRANRKVHNSPRHSGGGRKKAKRALLPAAMIGGASASELDGTGQTIGLLEFDTYDPSDVADYLAFIGAPSAAIANLSSVPINGGASPGGNQDEVLLDIDTVMTAAPGAKVVVYHAPFAGGASSYVSLFNAMINGGVSIISNSWASCEDQVSQADAQAIDTVLQGAAAAGISVFNGAGDSGSTCLDGAPNTIAVPADSPHATAVGGTTLTLGPGFTYGSETWWNGSAATPQTGQGGFGVSRYFSRPSYQNALNGNAMRSIPDVSTDADPATGLVLCQASDGGCPSDSIHGGTSMAAPEWAAFTAVLNQRLGSNLGEVNPAIYPFANTTAFNTPDSMRSDFTHVGLGSPNLDTLALQLEGAAPGAADASMSMMEYASTQVGGVDTLYSPVPADGSAAAVVVVTVADSNGDTISGKTVTLAASSSHAQITAVRAVTSNQGTAIFTVSDLTAESVTLTATDATDGVVISQTANVVFGVPPAAGASLNVFPTGVAADGTSATSITVVLKDSLGRPTPGKTVVVQDGGAHAVISGPASGVTDANGQIQFTATDQLNESVTFTAVDLTDGNLPIPGSATVTYSGSTNSSCGVGVSPVAGTGYAIAPFITGLPAAPGLFFGGINFGCPGAINPAFLPAGRVWVPDFLAGTIYQSALAGGSVSSSAVISHLNPTLGNVIVGKDGNLYATQAETSGGSSSGNIVQLDPASGSIVRVVASGLTCPGGLAVDPLSGDLFFDDQCTGAGTDNPSIFRVTDPAGSDASRSTSVIVYGTLPSTPNGGLAFAPNGTLYAVTGYYNNPHAPVMQVSGTSSNPVAVTALPGISASYGIAVGSTNADGTAQTLLVEPAGILTDIPLSNPSAATVLANPSPGVGVVGPDGCLYSAHYDTVYRLTGADGSCRYNPTNPAPALSLSPATVAPIPGQGTPQSFTASLRNASPLEGVPLVFQVSGANAQFKIARTDSRGNATLTYTGASAGTDSIVATATAGGPSAAPANIVSNVGQVTWAAGRHVTSISLNQSPSAGTVGGPFEVIASLTDVSVSPAASVAGQTLNFTLLGSQCTAITGSDGRATCQLTPAAAGNASLTASFDGSSGLLPAGASVGFNTLDALRPAPTVTISLSPTSVAVGAQSMLTWSSYNAVACTASGAWTGSQAIHGGQTVTASAPGTLTYTLTCTGSGGSASGSATLSVNLQAVTINAKGGGGALDRRWVALLSVLVLLRGLFGPGPRLQVGLCSRLGRRRALVSRRLGWLLVCNAVGIECALGTELSVPAAEDPAVTDRLYLGIRAGDFSLYFDPQRVDRQLAARGFSGIHAAREESAPGGMLYLGYTLTSPLSLEVGYARRNSGIARLTGTAAPQNLAPLLADTADALNGYGSLYTLSLRGRWEPWRRVSINPRIGGYFWESRVTVEADGQRAAATHRGGGVTGGVGFAYRLWRGLEIGLGADYFKGSRVNRAALYAGTLEWRFGS